MGWELLSDRGKTAWAFDGVRVGDPVDRDVPYDEKRNALPEMSSFNREINPNSGDKIYRFMMTKQTEDDVGSMFTRIPDSLEELMQAVDQSSRLGINYYQKLQQPEGFWPGDYGGPLFLMPGLVITCYVTQTFLPTPHRVEMKRYLFNHQNKDGGWGLHIEKLESTIFGSALNYVALRLLGAEKNDPRMVRARNFLLSHGGAGGIPSWGKFWLAVLGVYEWEGVNSIFPELWIIPEGLPIHPWRWWCHCRMVYLPMTYIYGHRVVGPITPLIKEIREEIYPDPYILINWNSYKDKVAKIDEYRGHSWFLQLSFAAVNFYEKFKINYFREKSLKFLIDYVRAEDEQTKFVDIGPVNKVINMLCRWHADGAESKGFQSHVARLEDYLWLAEDGMKMQGYNGSQLWDTTFAIMAINETGLSNEYTDVLLKAYHYVDISQVQEDVQDREKFYRHISKGGWPFSTNDHGWPIADCTAHGLEAVLQLHKIQGIIPKEKRISDERIFDAVNIIISFENAGGGWATYENTRGPAWLEWLNPSEVFGDIMIDYCYTELTSSAVQALCTFKELYPNHRVEEVNGCISRGIEYIKKQQRSDGSWYGSWAVCFTYGAFFAIEALQKAGEPMNSKIIKNGCAFLASKQKEDGGWGESYQSCVIHEYIQHEDSQAINTAWALIALMTANYSDRKCIDRGIKCLLKKQLASGDWPQEGISGVFNGNCMITYTAYRNVFPVRALGLYKHKYGGLP